MNRLMFGEFILIMDSPADPGNCRLAAKPTGLTARLNPIFFNVMCQDEPKPVRTNANSCLYSAHNK